MTVWAREREQTAPDRRIDESNGNEKGLMMRTSTTKETPVVCRFQTGAGFALRIQRGSAQTGPRSGVRLIALAFTPPPAFSNRPASMALN